MSVNVHRPGHSPPRAPEHTQMALDRPVQRRATPQHRSCRQASKYRTGCGNVSPTVEPEGREGRGRGAQPGRPCAAAHNPDRSRAQCRCHATGRSVLESPQRNLAKPPAEKPHRKNARNSSSTKPWKAMAVAHPRGLGEQARHAPQPPHIELRHSGRAARTRRRPRAPWC